MSDMRLLVIEDDSEAAAYLVKAFREQGHLADHAADGLDGYARAAEGDQGSQERPQQEQCRGSDQPGSIRRRQPSAGSRA